MNLYCLTSVYKKKSLIENFTGVRICSVSANLLVVDSDFPQSSIMCKLIYHILNQGTEHNTNLRNKIQI